MSRVEDVPTPDGLPEEPLSASLETLGPGLVLPLAGVLVGLGALKIASGGVSARPILAVLAFALGIAAALAPLRFGLPVAVVLAGFGGFLSDFAGDRATYWNEVFSALIVARSFVLRRPTRRDLAIAGAVAAVFLGYLATGTSLKADLWGLKVLLLSAVVGWAVARMRPDRRVWTAVYYGLALLTVANLVLELWQRSKGVSGLSSLGLVYGERIREITSGGDLRAFGGFTSAAPLSYALAITIAAWAGFLLGPREERRVALLTLWLPPIAVAGLYLTIDRTAILALVAAFAVLALTYRPRILVPAAAGLAALVGVAASFGFAAPFRHALGSAAHARATLWGDYMRDLRPFGRGPASAGSAYKKVAPKPAWVPPLRIPAQWDVNYSRIRVRGTQYPIVGTYLPNRPRLEFLANATAVAAPARLEVTLTQESRPLLARTIALGATTPIVLRVPAARRRAAGLTVAVDLPETAPRSRVQVTRPGPPVNLMLNPSFESGISPWFAWQGRGPRQTTVTSVATGSVFGARSMRVAHADGTPAGNQGAEYGNFPTAKGRRYTASFYARGSAGGETLYLYIQDPATPISLNSPQLQITKDWRRYSFSWTAWATDQEMHFSVRSGEEVGPQTFFVDAVQIEEADRPSSYCDGSVPHCLWTGIAEESTSYRVPSTRLVAAVRRAPLDALDTIHVASAWAPMPYRVPFAITLGTEEMQVVRILGIDTYRVRRGVDGTLPRRHNTGERVYADASAGSPIQLFRLPPAQPVFGEPVVDLRQIRAAGVPPPRSHAERVWKHWFAQTPAALQSDGPGLVDNLYVSWLWQYGVLGLVLCLGWLALLLAPVGLEKRAPVVMTAVLVGVFLIVAAFAVNVWEEAPTDLLAALVLASAFAAGRRASRPRPRLTRS